MLLYHCVLITETILRKVSAQLCIQLTPTLKESQQLHCCGLLDITDSPS
jgi:hypothetical protein